MGLTINALKKARDDGIEIFGLITTAQGSAGQSRLYNCYLYEYCTAHIIRACKQQCSHCHPVRAVSMGKRIETGCVLHQSFLYYVQRIHQGVCFVPM